MIGAGVTTNTADCQYCHPCQDSLLLSPLVPDDGDSVMHCYDHVHHIIRKSHHNSSHISNSQAKSVSKLFTYGQLFSRKMQKTYFHKPLFWFTSEL